MFHLFSTSPLFSSWIFFRIIKEVERRKLDVCASQSQSNCERYKYILGTMTLDQDFEAAAESIKSLTRRPTDEELLELYALFKQGSIGDVNTSKPGMLDLKGKAKWNQWNNKKGMSKEAAKEAYIAYANGLVEKYK